MDSPLKLLENKIYGWKAITISPPYSTIRLDCLHERYKKDIERYLRRISKAWAVYPELTKEARLHYHAVVHIDDEVAFYKGYHIIRKIGMVKIDPIRTVKDKIRWIFYISKDAPLTRGALSPHPVPMLPRKPCRRSRNTQSWNTPVKVSDYMEEWGEVAGTADTRYVVSFE